MLEAFFCTHTEARVELEQALQDFDQTLILDVRKPGLEVKLLRQPAAMPLLTQITADLSPGYLGHLLHVLLCAFFAYERQILFLQLSDRVEDMPHLIREIDCKVFFLAGRQRVARLARAEL